MIETAVFMGLFLPNLLHFFLLRMAAQAPTSKQENTLIPSPLRKEALMEGFIWLYVWLLT